MHRRLLPSLMTTTLFGLVSAPAALQASEPPSVVASIQPVATIAASIMDGVGTPTVLLEPGASPHATSLRPSQAEALTNAELILWIGPELETFLSRPLAALSDDKTQLALADVSGIELLAYREGATFDDHGEHEHAEDDHAEHEHDEHAHGAFDGHIWLSPANARVMAAAIANELTRLDDANADHYAVNLVRFDAQLDEVESEVDAILEPVRGQPFIVFHDAYHYFEDHFVIEAVGAVHVVPDVPPSAARVAEIREQIAGAEAVCVFAEPQFEPRLVQTLIEGTKARSGVLDPLGGDIELGPDAYPELLLQLARSLDDCLAG